MLSGVFFRQVLACKKGPNSKRRDPMFILTMSRVAHSEQCLTTEWTTGRSGFDPGRGKRIFPLVSVSRPALGPTQPPVQWVPGGPFPGDIARPGREYDHSLHLAPRLRMSRSYTSSPSLHLSYLCCGTVFYYCYYYIIVVIIVITILLLLLLLLLYYCCYYCFFRRTTRH
jgi:hypothetical protein